MSGTFKFFAGVSGVFCVSVCAIVLAPFSQLASLAPDFKKDEDGVVSDVYPTAGSGAASEGREIYVSQGCQTCHSQVLRGGETADLDRGWGKRRTVARDYLFETTPVFGLYRLGPDLANVGAPDWRNEPEGETLRPVKRDAAWHYLHLYEPRVVSKASNMPAYRNLFEVRKRTGSQSPDALVLPRGVQLEAGYEVVPKADAKSLVSYLMSLDRSHPLREAGGVTVSSKK